MEIYVLDAFSTQLFGGNQAGVALPDRPLSDETMRQIAAELKHSETAFVTQKADGTVALRYFTPAGEVELCGHATVASFALLRELGRIADGEHIARTKAGELTVTVRGGTVWMDMAPPRLIADIPAGESAALYAAYGLTEADGAEGYVPQIVSTGLSDIMLPVRNRAALLRAVQDEQAVTELSRRYNVTGVHMFCLGESGVTARCSNFAPLYDIPEECATGTSNGALTYYLYLRGALKAGEENLFLQGEHMGRPSEIRSILYEKDGKVTVRVGGSAVVSLSGEMKL